MSTPSEAVERRLYNALWWAKVQSAGPLAVDPDTPAVAGLTRASEPDGSAVWLVPTMPTGSGHAVLDELGTPPVAVEQPNETARVLAIVVACCWTDRSGSAWPGAIGTLTQVRAVYAGMRGRAEQSSDLTLIIGSLRRLHATHWIRWNEKDGEVRLGPRVINWTPADQATLRDLCRHLPDPPPAVLTTTPDSPPPDPLPTPEPPESGETTPDEVNATDEAASAGVAANKVRKTRGGANAPADVSPVDSTSGEAAPADPTNPLGDSTSPADDAAAPGDDVREVGDE